MAIGYPNTTYRVLPARLIYPGHDPAAGDNRYSAFEADNPFISLSQVQLARADSLSGRVYNTGGVRIDPAVPPVFDQGHLPWELRMATILARLVKGGYIVPIPSVADSDFITDVPITPAPALSSSHRG